MTGSEALSLPLMFSVSGVPNSSHPAVETYLIGRKQIIREMGTPYSSCLALWTTAAAVTGVCCLTTEARSSQLGDAES